MKKIIIAGLAIFMFLAASFANAGNASSQLFDQTIFQSSGQIASDPSTGTSFGYSAIGGSTIGTNTIYGSLYVKTDNLPIISISVYCGSGGSGNIAAAIYTSSFTLVGFTSQKAQPSGSGWVTFDKLNIAAEPGDYYLCAVAGWWVATYDAGESSQAVYTSGTSFTNTLTPLGYNPNKVSIYATTGTPLPSATNNYMISVNNGYYSAANSTGAVRYSGTSFGAVWTDCINDISIFGGGTINLGSGIFWSNFTANSQSVILPLTSNLLVNGSGNSTIIEPVSGIPIMGSTDIQLLGTYTMLNNVTIQNLQVNGNGYCNGGSQPNYTGQPTGMFAIAAYGSNWTIQNNFFFGTSDIESAWGNYVRYLNNGFENCSGSVYLDIGSSYNLVQGNTIINSHNTQDGAMSVVQFSWDDPSSIAGNNIINNNTLIGDPSDTTSVYPIGILVYSTTRLSITNNLIKNFAGQGIVTSGGNFGVSGTSFVSITNNTISNNHNNAIAAQAGYNFTIADNYISNNFKGVSGILVQSNNTVISGNTITAGWNGIQLYDGDNGTLAYDNKITDCLNSNAIQAYGSVYGFKLINNFLSGSITPQISVSAVCAHYYIANNTGYNPVGLISNPINQDEGTIVDGSGTSNFISGITYTNYGSEKTINISGGIVTSVMVNGALYSSSTDCTLTIEPLDTFSITFASSPTIIVYGN